MSNQEFLTTVKEHIAKGNSLPAEEREILLNFKNKGGSQATAKKLIEELALDLSDNEILQDRVYDILDIITGWCSSEIRVWK